MNGADGGSASGTLPGYADLRTRHLQLLAGFDEKSAGSDQLAAIAQFVEEGSAAGVGLDDEDERWSVQGFLDYWTTVLFRLDRMPPDAELRPFDLALAPTLEDAQCPYPGNRAFEESQTHLFFGRDEETSELAGLLATHRLVVLTGDYGTGKTSLIRAGLVPRLRGEGWEILPYIVPAVPPQIPAEARGPGAGGGARSLLVADQLEDIPTRAYVAALIARLREHLELNPGLRILLSIRTSAAGVLTGLVPDGDRAYMELRPVGPALIKTLVTAPAAAVGLKLENRLVQALVRELTVEPEPLPLLQFVLRRLWETREDNKNLIRYGDYRAIAGQGRHEGPVPRLALVAAAEGFLEGLDEPSQALLGRVLTLTVRVETGGQATPRKIAVAPLRELGRPGQVGALIGALDEAGLVKVDGPLDGHCYVELIHEALVRHWPRLQTLVSRHQLELDLRARLETAARNWDWGAPRARLWRRWATIRESARLQGLCPVERAFLGRSVRRVKLLAAAGGLALAGLLAAGIALVPKVSYYAARISSYTQAFDLTWSFDLAYRTPSLLEQAVSPDVWRDAGRLGGVGCVSDTDPSAAALCRLLRFAGKASDPAIARLSVKQDASRSGFGWSGVVENFRFPGKTDPLLLSFRGYSDRPLEETRTVTLEFFQYRLSDPKGKEMASFELTLTRADLASCFRGDFPHPLLTRRDGDALVIADVVLAEPGCGRR